MYRYLCVVLARSNVTLPGMNIRDGSTTVPRAGYADLPPGIGFEPKDEPLRRDINLLGRVLGRVLIEQEGEELFETEEEVRLLCKRLRFDYDPELDERLRRRIDAMSVEELRRIVRAFSVYFQLVNIAERYHGCGGGGSTSRHRTTLPSAPRWRAPSHASRAKVSGKKRCVVYSKRCLSASCMTAHPTEAMRRSVRRKHVRIGEMLESMESPDLTWKERRRLEEDLAEEITVLWQTEELRVRRPEVDQEIERTLLFFENPLISATLEAYREFEDELSRQFPEDTPRLGRVLEFGSWVGGDQDGNPFVEPEMITTALGLHREIILERHLASVVWLADHMSQSARMIPVSEELRRSVERDEGLMPGLGGALQGGRPERGLPAQAPVHVRALEAGPRGNQALLPPILACPSSSKTCLRFATACCRTAGCASPKEGCGI